MTHRFAARGSSCNEAAVDGENLIDFVSGGPLSCRTGCGGDVGDTRVYCTDFSVTDYWSAGERAYIYSFTTTLSYFEAMY